MALKDEITEWFKGLQDSICAALEAADGKARFREDKWDRKLGGGGRSRVISDGAVLEKGGVMFSAVHGDLPLFMKKEVGSEAQFYATGVSIVIHPQSPMVPIIHMNVRYFEMTDGTCWFGGGIDLTPHYVSEEDARMFHAAIKNTCDRFHPSYYPDFKKWADDYFFLEHRNETRGIGGIFFDRLSATAGFTIADRWNFVKAVGETFAPVYTALMQKNRALPFGDEEKKWQLLRRGRYVEFNLVYDKGTRFGLETGGRTESILVSLPATAGWLYDHKPSAREATTLSYLKKGISWV